MHTNTLLTGLLTATLIPSLAAADIVVLSNGDRFEDVEVTADTDESVSFNHPILGSQTVPKADVSSVISGNAMDEIGDEPPQTFNSILDGWDSRFEAGINGAEGNTDNLAAYAGVIANRESATTRQIFDARFQYGESNDAQDTGKFTMGLRNDWLVEDQPYFYFAEGRLDWDNFQVWEYRVQGFVGAGYRYVETDDYSLDLLAGLGATKEFNSPRNEWTPEAMLGFDVNWDISDHQNLVFRGRLFPDLSELSDFRITNDLAWVMDLPDNNNYNLSIGIRHEYDSKNNAPVNKNDLFYYIALGFDF